MNEPSSRAASTIAAMPSYALRISSRWSAPNEFAARVTSTMITFIRSGSWRYESMMKPATERSLSREGSSRASISPIASSMICQRSRKSVLRISSFESK